VFSLLFLFVLFMYVLSFTFFFDVCYFGFFFFFFFFCSFIFMCCFFFLSIKIFETFIYKCMIIIFELDFMKSPRISLVFNIIHLHISHQQLYTYHYVAKKVLGCNLLLSA